MEGGGINMDFIIAGIISIALLVYLVYVIFNPEKLK
jgi:K+-transporting ATPase KdpF subunit